jgi:hypothetical protein
MSLWDTLFGSEDVRKAMSDRTYLDPSAITDPAQKAAALEAGKRMEISKGLGNAAAAISAANMKGGRWGDLLAAGAGGFAQGGDDVLKQQYAAAQTRGALAQAKYHEAQAKSYDEGRPPTVRDQWGRVHRLVKGQYVAVPIKDQEGYAGLNLPPMPTGYNPDQRVIAGSSGGQGSQPMTYTDTASGQKYISTDGGKTWQKAA